jgi:hypothetical protein
MEYAESIEFWCRVRRNLHARLHANSGADVLDVSHRRAGADVVGDFAGEELAVGQGAF